MVEAFGHEKLVVYQKGLAFVAMRKTLLEGLSRRVAACDHLDRAAESIMVNIAHASSSWSPKERIVFLGQANGSALECAACLDIFVAKDLTGAEQVYPCKSLLGEIVSMLIRMWKTTGNRIREERAVYRTEKDNLFSHEDLDVYQRELQFIRWLEGIMSDFTCSPDLLSNLDKSTTSIVLNTAEGNGRFSEADHAKFLGLAFKATVQSSTLLDLATIDCSILSSKIEEGRNLLRQIAAMLTSLTKSIINEK